MAVTHASNVLGTINPVAEIARLAHDRGAALLVDGAQGAPHLPVDVRALDCDFYLFSGHKLCGPTGVGVLYGKRELLEAMPPWEGGGSMIESVSFEKTTFTGPPTRFEAGTPNIAGAIGLEAAVDYVNDVGPERIDQYEQSLLAYAAEKLTEVEGLRIFGTSDDKVAGDLLRAGGGPPPRHRHDTRPRGGGHPHRPPLRPAVDVPLRGAGDGARLAGFLQHPRGGRRAGRRPRVGALGAGVMEELRELYQQVILDHNRNPRNFGRIDGANRRQEGYNPLCGDHLQLHLQVGEGGGEAVIEDISFEGSGCAISKASASLMTEALKGSSAAEARQLFERFHDLVTADPADAVDTSGVGKLAVFAGVREFPMRVKCATLAWHAMKAALEADEGAGKGAEQAVTTE